MTLIQFNTYIHTCMHAYIHTHTHTHTHAYIPTYLRTYVHTYVRTYIHTYLHTYIHTCIYLYISCCSFCVPHVRHRSSAVPAFARQDLNTTDGCRWDPQGTGAAWWIQRLGRLRRGTPCRLSIGPDIVVITIISIIMFVVFKTNYDYFTIILCSICFVFLSFFFWLF